MWKKAAESRIELPDYNERSVFESLVNALIHRDYLINGSEVHVDMFNDRLVIYSPGGMPDGTLIQERRLEDVPSTRRNPLLADIFARLGLMERQGSGLSKICNWYKNEANYDNDMEPKFRSNNVEFTVTLPNLNFKVSKNEALNEALNGNEKLLLSLFTKNPRLTQKCIMETTGLSRATVQRVIKRLTDIGCLERAGSRKAGQWIVVGKD